VLAAAACGESLDVEESPAPDASSSADSPSVPPTLEGGGGGDPPDADPPDGPKPACALPSGPIVFVTSGTFTGERGALADETCTEAAKRAGIHRTFVAYIRIGTTSPWDHIPRSHNGWSLPTGEVVFNPADTVQFASPNVAINVTEKCVSLTDNEERGVWIGNGPYDCQGWLSAGNDAEANVGNRRENDFRWMSGTTRKCNEALRFYCFQE